MVKKVDTLADVITTPFGPTLISSHLAAWKNLFTGTFIGDNLTSLIDTQGALLCLLKLSRILMKPEMSFDRQLQTSFHALCYSMRII